MNHLCHKNKSLLSAMRSMGIVKNSLAAFAVNRHAPVQRSPPLPLIYNRSVWTASSDMALNAARDKGADYLRRVRLCAPTGRALEIQIVHGHIAEEKTDVIVNPANPAIFNTISLNDVSFAILEKGGDELKHATQRRLAEEESTILPIGHVMFTASTGALKSKYIIHAVGPIWSTEHGDESIRDNKTKDEQLSNAVLSALKLADSLSAQSISLPAISTFLNGGSRSRVARVLFDTILNGYYMDMKGHGDQRVKLLRLINSDEIATSCMCNEFDKREFANHPHCTHIHSAFNIPITDLPQPDEADSDRNSPYLAD